jgi:hypothetical protein
MVVMAAPFVCLPEHDTPKTTVCAKWRQIEATLQSNRNGRDGWRR